MAFSVVPNYDLLKELVAAITLLDFLFLSPFFYRYVGSPYNPSSFINSRTKGYLVMLLLVACAVALALNFHALIASFLLLIFFRYQHIDQRFRSLARGAGAVGYMPYHILFFVFLCELFMSLNVSQTKFTALYDIYVIEVAVIFLCAGISKGLAGYAQGNGFEVALANPFWSNFFNFHKRLKPSSSYFKVLNYFGFLTEGICGILLLFPVTRLFGAILIIMIFGFILLNLNLAFLPVIMIALSVLFLPDLGWKGLFPKIDQSVNFEMVAVADWMIWIFASYVALVVLTKLYLYGKVYGKLSYPKVVVKIFEFLASKTPIFIWRVFTADVTNIFVRISQSSKGKSSPIWNEDMKTSTSFRNFIMNYRFYHVAEMVVLTTIFNQLKYHVDGIDIAKKKLLQYCKTLSSRVENKNNIVIELVIVDKSQGKFSYIPLYNFIVNMDLQRVDYEELNPDPMALLKIKAY